MKTSNNNSEIVSGSKVYYHGEVFDVGEVYSDTVRLYHNGKEVVCAPKCELTII